MKKLKIAPIKPTVPFDLFDKIDIRVGTIEHVEDVKGANKLIRLIVDFGNHTRTILAGTKQERKDPVEIRGKQALFVVNFDDLVKSPKSLFFVIPAKAGIQYFHRVTKNLDPVFQRGDDFLRNHQS
jgi:tRNA-binding EMAP/Myf-like protein